MSDPLVTELQDIASMHTRGGGLSNLLLRAADALESAAVREQRLRAALELAAPFVHPDITRGPASPKWCAMARAVAIVLTTDEFDYLLAGDALPAAPEQAAHA